MNQFRTGTWGRTFTYQQFQMRNNLQQLQQRQQFLLQYERQRRQQYQNYLRTLRFQQFFVNLQRQKQQQSLITLLRQQQQNQWLVSRMQQQLLLRNQPQLPTFLPNQYRPQQPLYIPQPNTQQNVTVNIHIHLDGQSPRVPCVNPKSLPDPVLAHNPRPFGSPIIEKQRQPLEAPAIEKRKGTRRDFQQMLVKWQQKRQQQDLQRRTTELSDMQLQEAISSDRDTLLPIGGIIDSLDRQKSVEKLNPFQQILIAAAEARWGNDWALQIRTTKEIVALR